jgi:fluoride exporter
VRVVWIAIAGAGGALSRYGIGMAFGGRTFPWATVGVNVAGSFLLGLLLRVAELRAWSNTVTLPLAVGFLGAFTTFSTFSWETTNLLREARTGAAAAYVAMSLVGGVLAAAAGYAVARSLA